MNDFLHFRDLSAAMASAETGPLPLAQHGIGIVRKLCFDGMCEVDAVIDGRRSIITARVTPIMEDIVHTGQFVAIAEGGYYGPDVTDPLSTTYQISTQRFLTFAQLARHDAAQERKARRARMAGAINSKLDTPVKRLGGLALAVGAVLLVIGLLIAFAEANRYRTLESVASQWWDSITHTGRSSRRIWALTWGTYLVGAGVLFSIAYDSTIGRLVGWVRTGRHQPK